MERCFALYRPDGRLKIADLGASDVNGSYRTLAGGADYVGLDLAPGPGVDIVQDDPYRIPLGDASVDLVLSGQMLEHCAHFWRVFGEIARILAPEGLAFVIAPSAGPIHRYPVDCYRFYPDAYQALTDWAGLRLVDCWLDERGPWRDLVGVFQKGGTLAARLDPVDGGAIQSLQFVDEHADPAAEAVGGARSYLEALADIHATLAPRLYLEIGVRRGHSLALARGRAVAVDPAPELDAAGPNVALHTMTSDDFFRLAAGAALGAPVDLAFIDGMHHAEFVWRDFMNVERRMAPGGAIVIDDVFPNHPLQARRDRQTRVWTGDVWKFVAALSRLRPDLRLTLFDTHPTGLLVVSRLDPRSRVLWDHYNPEVRTMRDIPEDAVPAAVLERAGAVPPTAEALRAALGR